MSDVQCNHLTLKKQADNSPSNLLHNGDEKAYRCLDCSAIFFVDMTPAQIKVTYPEAKP
jgi:hypothetical protein